MSIIGVSREKQQNDRGHKPPSELPTLFRLMEQFESRKHLFEAPKDSVQIDSNRGRLWHFQFVRFQRGDGERAVVGRVESSGPVVPTHPTTAKWKPTARACCLPVPVYDPRPDLVNDLLIGFHLRTDQPSR